MRRICSSLIFVFMWIDMRLYGALIYTDFLLLESIRAVQAQILSEYNPKPCDNTRLKEIRSIRSIRSIRVRLTSEFFRTRIYRIDADYFLLGYIQRRTGANKNPKKKQDQVYLRFRKSVKKIKSVASVLSVSHFERVRTEPKAKEHYNVVLSSRQPISACL